MKQYPVFVTPEARGEINAAAEWYGSKREELRQQFYDRVDEAAEKIERAPEGFQKVYKDARRVTLEQFKDWALWYLARPDKSLVIGCLSGRRHPSLARERASGVIPMRPPDPS